MQTLDLGSCDFTAHLCTGLIGFERFFDLDEAVNASDSKDKGTDEQQ